MTSKGHNLMEKKGASLFQTEANSLKFSRNIVELEVLETRRRLRQKVCELIRLATYSNASTEEIKHSLSLRRKEFGAQLSSQLLRSLSRADYPERQSIVLLLILLNDPQIIASLRHISLDSSISRSIRLSAALALAGMGATVEAKDNCLCTRQRAIR